MPDPEAAGADVMTEPRPEFDALLERKLVNGPRLFDGFDMLDAYETGRLTAAARAERLAEAVDAWMRFAHHAADRKWTIPLWGALLWERAIDASNAALAGDAPGRGEK